MVHVDYVHPNLSQAYLKSESQRGGLLERWKLAENTGCKYIEMPCHLIYNKTEEKITGLNIGDFLGEKEIKLLYTHYDTPKNLEYVFHTDPSIGKRNIFGQRIFASIDWHQKEWCKKYCEMILSISDYLEHQPSIIEIHPGYKNNNHDDIVYFEELLLDSFKEQGNTMLQIFLENRTEQFISTGKEIGSYWTYINDNYPHLIDKTGIVLDVQQLHTKTENRFLQEYDLIPENCLKGFHIHTKHQYPKLNDPIPWRYVFGKIKKIDHTVIINPEIHQKKRVTQTIDFCNNLLG